MLAKRSRRSRALKTSATATSMGAVAAIVLLAAISHPETRIADIDLNDAGVWTVNNSQGQLGRVNVDSLVLDGAVATAGVSADVVQEDSLVYLRDHSAGTYTPVDPAAMALGTPLPLPPGAELSLGGSQALVVQPERGRVWATAPTQLGAFAGEQTPPLAEAEHGLLAAIGEEDTVHVLDPASRQLTSYEPGPEGYAESASVVLEGNEPLDGAALVAVGPRPAVLDPKTGTVHLPSGRAVEIPQTRGGVLQQDSFAASTLAIATEQGLALVDLDDGAASWPGGGGGGNPARPYRLGECAYGAWAGANRYLRACEDPADNDSSTFEGSADGARLAFRENHGRLILNDAVAGATWLIDHDLRPVDNWEDQLPPPEDDDDQEESSSQTVNTTLPDRSGKNTPPKAQDDTFGVRPGRTTVLPVLNNDADADGDILRAELQGPQPGTGTVQSIYAGSALQVVVPATAAPGRHDFTYLLLDGRGGTDTGTVRLEVRPDSANTAPLLQRPARVVVEQGRSVTWNALADWIDPDGDEFFLLRADPEDQDAKVTFTRSGDITYRASHGKPGHQWISVEVGDGRDTRTEEISIEVLAADSADPVAYPDFATARTGEATVVEPLENDYDPSGRPLRLARVDPESGGSVKEDFAAGAFTFTADAPGSYYVRYLVTNGSRASEALVRIDVVDPGGDGAPVAVRDLALLPQGGDVLVDPLANDTDPAGNVLVVTSVDGGGNPRIGLTLEGHRLVRITDARGLDEPVTVGYVVSNGRQSAAGEITVVPLGAPAKPEPPVIRKDEAVVRAGDSVSIPVLANDSSPGGLELRLDQKLVEVPAAHRGRLFATDGRLRFIAGTEPGTVHAVYRAVDEDGRSGSAQVEITITPADASANARPVPEPVEGRAVAGKLSRIFIPLDGIDPDGDSVELVGLDTAPELGSVAIGGNYIDYTPAADAAGTDAFTYKVRDRLGAEAIGTIRVGVAAPADQNLAPVTAEDHRTVRPGRELSVPVLANDSDPDGDALTLVPDAVEAPPGTAAEVVDNQLRVTAPSEEGTAVVRYTVRDARGAETPGDLVLTVDPRAEALPPLARDDRLGHADIVGRTEVEVPLLRNDEDPDGTTTDLEVELGGAADSVALAPGGIVSVALTGEAQEFTYTVTDRDGLASTALVRIPAGIQAVPTLRSSAPLPVEAGADLRINLAELVQVRADRTPRIGDESTIRAVAAAGKPRIEGPSELVFSAPADYAGPASLTLEVTDGTSAEDPDALAALVTVPIRVLPAPERNTAPQLAGGSLAAAVGEEPGRLDLSGLATDPDPDDAGALGFSLSHTGRDGVELGLDGTVLGAGAGLDAVPGGTVPVTVTVQDREGATASADVLVRIVASNRPLATVVDDAVDDARAGRQVRVPVLANDVSPFPGEPLRLVRATTQAGNGTASLDGDGLLVTPAADSAGQLVVRYTVEDRTGSADRRVDGTVTLTVRGRPDAPERPYVEEVRDSTVVLSWAEPYDNGLPVTGYRVEGSNGVVRECRTTTCTIDGLRNAQPYTFTVSATNEEGRSDPSPASAQAIPDTVPEAPAAPNGTAGDRTLEVGWKVPVNRGSSVDSYNLRISPSLANGTNEVRGVTATSHSFTGLENGTAYRVQVQAVNDAGTSPWSAASTAQTPAGLPRQPSGIAVGGNNSGATGGSSNASVSWSAADGNGAPVTAYRLRVLRGGSVVSDAQVSGTSKSLALQNSDTPYSFEVTAVNRVGAGQPATSSPVRFVGRPGAVADVTAAEADTGGAGRQVKIGFPPLDAAQRNGARASEISYRWSSSDGRSGSLSPSSSGGRLTQTLGGFANGASATVSVTAVASSSEFVSQTGAATASNAVVPYGAPLPLTVSVRNATAENPEAVFSWPAPVPNGEPIIRLQYKSLYDDVEKPWVDMPASQRSHTIRIGQRGSTGTYAFRSCVQSRTGGERCSVEVHKTASRP